MLKPVNLDEVMFYRGLIGPSPKLETSSLGWVVAHGR
jgi:hypothetical protein